MAFEDVDRGDTYSPTTVRPSPNQANEADRWLPSGVRAKLRELEADEDVQNLPPSIVKYLQDHELVHFPKRGPNMGKLVLTPFGIKIRNNNIKKLEGKGP